MFELNPELFLDKSNCNSGLVECIFVDAFELTLLHDEIESNLCNDEDFRFEVCVTKSPRP